MSSRFEGKKVLIVEDNATHRAQIQKIMEDKAIKVIMCVDGEEAISKLEFANELDLVILDWNLPGISGLGVARQINLKKELGEINNVPIVAFTANKDPGDREQCLEIGMDDYLSKEIWLPSWESKLDEILNKWLMGEGKDGNVPETKEEKEDYSLEVISETILNERTFRNAKELMGEQIGNITESYLVDARIHIDKICEAIKAKDHGEVKAHAHPLKSTSMSMGLDKMGSIAASMEKDARIALDKGLEPMYPESYKTLLINTYNQGEEALKKALNINE